MDTIKLLAWLAYAVIRGVIRSGYGLLLLLVLMLGLVVLGWDDRKDNL